MIRKSVLIIASIFVSRFVIFAISPFYFKGLETQSIASIEMYVLIASFASIIVGLEFNQAISRYFPAMNDDVLARGQLVSTVCAVLAVTIIIAPIVFGALKVLQGSKFLFFEFVGIVSFSLATAISSIVQAYLRSRFLDRQLIVFNIIYAAAIFFLTVALYYLDALSVLTYLAIPAIACLLSLALSLDLNRSDFCIPLQSQIQSVKRYLLYSYPLVLVALINASFFYSDRAVIIGFLGEDALALYGLGMRFSIVISFIYMTVGVILTPLIMRSGICLETERYIERALLICIVGIVFSALMLVSWGDEIILMLSTDEYLPLSSALMSFVTLAVLTNSYVFMPGIDLRYKTYLHILPTIIGILIFYTMVKAFPTKNFEDILIAKLCAGYVYFVTQFFLNRQFMKPPLALMLINSAFFIGSIFEMSL